MARVRAIQARAAGVRSCVLVSMKSELSGGETATTNNRMEIDGGDPRAGGVEEAFDCHDPHRFALCDGRREKWLARWKANGWRTADKKPVKNEDLWRALEIVLERHEVSWRWVDGHSGHAENERADASGARGDSLIVTSCFITCSALDTEKAPGSSTLSSVTTPLSTIIE